MDLNKTAVFAKVAETLSFTAAAKALGLPKSSVSRSVAQLEDALGVRLIQRTTRKLSLTDAGAGYYQRVAQALAALEEASACAADLQASPRGTVRITAPVDVGVWMLADLVARFVQKHPGIRIDLALTSRTLNLVEEGFDLAVRAGRLSDSSLVARKLGTIDSWLLAAPKYLTKRGTPIEVDDLVSHDCVLFRPTGSTSEWHLEGPSGKESVKVSGPVGADDFTFLHEVVLAGTGIGVFPALLFAAEIERGRLVRVLPKHRVRGGLLHLVYPSARYLPQRVQLLRDFLVERLGSLPWGSP